jgi:hypothetical protein
MARTTYDIELSGLGFTTSHDPTTGEAYIRIGSAATLIDGTTDPFALSMSIHGLARTVEEIGTSIENAQGAIPFSYVDPATDASDARGAYEQSYLFTEFFRRGLIAARCAHEHASPSVHRYIDDLIVHLDHVFVLGARTHEQIREAIERTAPIGEYASRGIE